LKLGAFDWVDYKPIGIGSSVAVILIGNEHVVIIYEREPPYACSYQTLFPQSLIDAEIHEKVIYMLIEPYP